MGKTNKKKYCMHTPSLISKNGVTLHRIKDDVCCQRFLHAISNKESSVASIKSSTREVNNLALSLFPSSFRGIVLIGS